MVIKGGARGGAKNLAKHLLRADTNEGVAVVELRHVAATDLTGALLDMEAVALGTKARRALYHASLSTRPDESLTPEQWQVAMDRLEAALGFTDHARAAVMHRKAGRTHLHVVWSRIDLTRMRAVHDGHNYRRHELVARELERLFGHARVQGAHVERDGVERPKRTPSPDEMQQAARIGIAVADVKDAVTALWRKADTGAAFVAALEDAGFILAMGDKRSLVILDRAGGVHALAKRIDGATSAEVRARLAGVDEAAALPSVAEARERLCKPAIAQSLEQPADEMQPYAAHALEAPVVRSQVPTVGPDATSEPASTQTLARTDRPQAGTARPSILVAALKRLGDLTDLTGRAVFDWIRGLKRERGPPEQRQTAARSDAAPQVERISPTARTTAKPTKKRSPTGVLLSLLGLSLHRGPASEICRDRSNLRPRHRLWTPHL